MAAWAVRLVHLQVRVQADQQAQAAAGCLAAAFAAPWW
jgi:hypothetical protein